MKKLTKADIQTLHSFKDKSNGSTKFFDHLEYLYRNDMETLNEIHRCREIKESLDWIESYPAYEKTRSTFYWNMKDILEKIGYHN